MTSKTSDEGHIIHAVNILYFGQEAQSDLPELMNLAEQDPEWAESHPSTKYAVNSLEIAEENGKVAALRYLYDEFIETTEEYSKWHFLSVVETNDIQVLADLNQRRTAIIRGMSFFEQYFKAKLGINPDKHTSIAGMIDDAKDIDVITKQEQKILQFVRELRNDVAHYSWLDPKFDDRLLHLSVEAQLYVVGNVMLREHSQHKEIEGDPAEDFDPQELISHLEKESGWVYDERDKRWFIP